MRLPLVYGVSNVWEVRLGLDILLQYFCTTICAFFQNSMLNHHLRVSAVTLLASVDKQTIVADTYNYCITSQGRVSTPAGTSKAGYRDGEGAVAQFNEPSAVVVDGGGNIILADNGNRRIRLITPQGRVSTLAGTGKEGYQDGEGTNAQFNSPSGLAGKDSLELAGLAGLAEWMGAATSS
jgi:hypothetical protein